MTTSSASSPPISTRRRRRTPSSTPSRCARASTARRRADGGCRQTKAASCGSQISIRSRRRRPARVPASNRLVARARRKFLRAFPGGFRDETYLDWERDYKWQAHLRWQENLSESAFRRLIDSRQFETVAKLASSIESRTNLLFSFEKMALRDAVRSPAGAQAFSCALFDFLHGPEPAEMPLCELGGGARPFAAPADARADLAACDRVRLHRAAEAHFFFKPTVTREALRRCGMPLQYASRPDWPLYKNLLDSVGQVKREHRRDAAPRHDRYAVVSLGARLG